VRKRISSLIAAVLLGGLAVTASSTPAQAEPCGASSWVEAVHTQSVAYRNCSTASIRVLGWIDPPVMPYLESACKTIGGGRSSYLIDKGATLNGYAKVPWGVRLC
jgi:hypothetical protein